MLANELRQKYLEFFAQRGHVNLPSAPLIPIDALGTEDKSTLFTSAGMQQFMPFFLGKATPSHTRVTTVQKCVRTGDIESFFVVAIDRHAELVRVKTDDFG